MRWIGSGMTRHMRWHLTFSLRKNPERLATVSLRYVVSELENVAVGTVANVDAKLENVAVGMVENVGAKLEEGVSVVLEVKVAAGLEENVSLLLESSSAGLEHVQAKRHGHFAEVDNLDRGRENIFSLDADVVRVAARLSNRGDADIASRASRKTERKCQRHGEEDSCNDKGTTPDVAAIAISTLSVCAILPCGHSHSCACCRGSGLFGPFHVA